MKKQNRLDVYYFINNFVFIHMVFYFLAAAVYMYFKETFPETEKALLDFFRLYRLSGRLEIITEVLRGVFLSIIFYYFYNTDYNRKSNVFIIAGVFWGMVLFGSASPFPGSFEGIIYTTAPFKIHLFMVLLGLSQVLMFGYIFAGRYKLDNASDFDIKKITRYYAAVFTVLHVITYAAAAVVFRILPDYRSVLEAGELFSFFRPPGHPAVLLAVPLQVIRGALLSVFVFPFYYVCRGSRKNWIILFAVLLGLTGLLSPVIFHEISRLISERSPPVLLRGLPEATVQTLLFSLLFFKVDKAMEKKGLVRGEDNQ